MGENNLYIIDNYKIINKPNLNTSLITPSTVNAYTVGVQYIREWFLSKFPSDFFKSINIEGRHTFYDFRKMTKEEMLKRIKPALSISPRLQIEYDREFIDSYPFGAKMFARHCNHHESFFKDYDNNLFIGLVPEMMLIETEFKLKLSSRAQQVDIYKFMQLNMRIGYSQGEYVAMDYHIPYNIMLQLAIDAGFEVKDDLIVDVPKFLYYVNSHSSVPILYKMRTINATDEFFMRFDDIYTWISCFEPLSMDDGEKEGMINTSFIIEMRCQLKIPSPKMYVYFSNTKHVEIERRSIIENIIGVYNIHRIDIPPTNSKGWNKLLTTEYFEELEKGQVLTIDFTDLFKDSEIGKVIDYNNSIAISSSICIDFLLLNGGRQVDYEMDWETLTLKTKEPLREDLTTIAIYTDTAYINNFILNNKR